MSKIEEALEKANKLRGPSGDVKSRLMDISRRPEHQVENEYLVTITRPDSPVAEEYRRLKSILIRETKADFLNTIMVTSSVDGEGKSLTAVNLAITLAQEIDHTILLIDADLRKPMIHEYLGISHKYGLADYLSGDIDFSEIVVKAGIGNLMFIPAGHVAVNPVELLASEKMNAFIKEIKHRYVDRYVIIDTPPILPFADAIAVGSVVDGVVFVIKEGRTQKKSIENAMNLMRNLRVLGIVFNHASEENLDGHYYNTYYYNRTKK
ncbi:MAG: polysaccharide biosynthesis tyrosine autokinase [Nitrospiraceae bacterium]|nr:MAG: polysaccharide biosynthesis tyrosine autokinase [Nitrospiraceae bacterium]